MSDQIDFSQRLEQLYATGDMVGIVLTPKTFQDLNAERDRLRAEVVELRQALEAARQELRDKAAIVAERDLFLRELEGFRAERIADADKNGIDLVELIAELEQDLRMSGKLEPDVIVDREKKGEEQRE